jgi:hypothetical protein
VSGRSVHTFSASTLERLERGGARVSFVPAPGEMSAAVDSLSPTRDVALLLRGTQDDGAPYELSVTPVRDEGMVVCFAQGRVLRWLGRGSDETPLADGDGFPAKVLVPRTWASSALLLATLSGELPRTLPWHDAKFSSLGTLSLDEVSFARCSADPQACVAVMAARIATHLAGSAEPERAFEDVIAELRRVGHDLWSFDQADDLGGIWCRDYMRQAEGQGLILEFGWRSVRARFGDATAAAP